MANTFRLKRSSVPSKIPATGDLQLGELALNTYDGKLYTKRDNGTASIVEIGGAGGSGGASMSTGSGAPTTSPVDGTLYVDITNHRLYVRSGGTWKYVQLGALTWQSGT